MCRSALDRPLRTLAGQESVDQSGGKRIASANAIIDFKIPAHGRFVKNPVRVADRAPIVAAGRICLAQGRSHHAEGKLLDHLLDHLLERFDLDIGNVFVHPRHFKAKRRREVFLVAEHYIHQRGQLAIDLLRPFLAAYGLPERLAVVQIVGDNYAMPAGCLHRFHGDPRRRLR